MEASFRSEVPCGSPLTKTEEETDRTQVLIRDIQLFAKPIFSIKFSRKTHST